jgi:hypothetical protein
MILSSLKHSILRFQILNLMQYHYSVTSEKEGFRLWTSFKYLQLYMQNLCLFFYP